MASASGRGPSESEGRIGVFGTFASAGVERAFRQRHFRDERWLSSFILCAGMLRVALLLLADYQHFGLSPAFWPLLACRGLFLLISAAVLVALRRAASPTTADQLFLGWCGLLTALTCYALSARPPDNNALLLMSFGVILAAYCMTPLPFSRQAFLALTFSAVSLYVCRHSDGVTLSLVGLAYVLSHLFGGITSWRLNHRRRQEFLGALREAELRATLEKAVAETDALRGLLCICAWCRRIRNEVQAWQTVEAFVQSQTQATFTHGICPDCLHSQAERIKGSRFRPGVADATVATPPP